MYKNPELSSMAKILAAELKDQGFELKHTKALELVAKMHGARTLHVHQAELAKVTPAVSAGYAHTAELRDSRLARGDAEGEVAEAHRRIFQADVAVHSDTITVDLQLPGLIGEALDRSDQLSLTVSVENGRPSVYLGNDRNSDTVLQVIGCEGGLYLAPVSSAYSVRTGLPAEQSLRAIQEEFVRDGTGHSRWNDAFISNPNS